MKSFILTTVLALAASTAAQEYNQSAPFHLVIISSNATINGSNLISCHEGAAIEGLCAPTTTGLTNEPGSLYQFNTTSDQVVANATAGLEGTLTYELAGGNFNISEPLSLLYYPISNVALPLFEPGTEVQQVAFDECDKLNIQGYLDDTTDPTTVGYVLLDIICFEAKANIFDLQTNAAVLPMVRLPDILHGIHIPNPSVGSWRRRTGKPDMPEGRCQEGIRLRLGNEIGTRA